MKYREDIDCLRGISVLAVVFYHLEISNFSGGFLGVDIFFVISGYLITSIILNDISNNNFSLIKFYERRIRRIIPVLLLVLLTTYFFYQQIYLENELKQLFKTIISTLLFFSNFYFLNLGSYFNPINESIPLLHTWSLSIEEQFYLFFPILIIFFKKKVRNIFLAIIFLIICSFSLSQFGGNLKFNYPYIEENFNFFSVPKFAFYLTLTRIWEILIGCALAIYLFNNKKIPVNKIFTIAGYVMIFTSFIFFDKYTLHPSFFTLIPLSGTILILTFSDVSFNKHGLLRIVNNGFFLKVGLISYSLYLWHQPIYQYFNLVFITSFSLLEKTLLIFLMIFISYLSFKYVEKPFRNKKFFGRKFIYYFFITCSLFILTFFSYNLLFKDISKKYSEQVKKISSHSNYYIDNEFNCSSDAENYLPPKKSCILGNEPNTEIAFIGDSHLDLISIELKKQLIEKKMSAFQFSHGGCVPALNVKVYADRRYQCDRYFNEVLLEIKSKPELKKIIFFSRWPFNISGKRFNNQEGGVEIGENHYFISTKDNYLTPDSEREKLILNEINSYINEIYKMNKKIYIIMPVPEMGWEIPNNLARQLNYYKKLDPKTLSISKKIFLDRNKKVFDFFNSIKEKYSLKLIFLDDLFCDNERCYAHKNQIPLYFDDDHLSKEGAKLVSKKIINELSN